MKDKDPKKKLVKTKGVDAILHLVTTFNNTIMTVTDIRGGTLFWSSSGKQGFKGSKKATPFSAQIVGECIGKTAIDYGIKTLKVKVSGPGVGREPAIRAIYSCGIKIISLEDVTAIPHNGCKQPKRRRV
jgi:small subunit ribosomal protein S11